MVEMEQGDENFKVKVWLMDGTEFFMLPILYFYKLRMNRFVVTYGQLESEEPFQTSVTKFTDLKPLMEQDKIWSKKNVKDS